MMCTNFLQPAVSECLGSSAALSKPFDCKAHLHPPRPGPFVCQVNLDLVTLALYDIVIWADDSTSMQALDGGERINDLKAILGRVADAATLFDDDGKFFPSYCLGHTTKSS